MFTKVYSKGNNWRMTIIHSNPYPTGRTYTIQYCWGKYDYPVAHFRKMLGSLKAAMEGSYGMGREKWYHDLSRDKAAEQVEILRLSAIKAGFVWEGDY